MASILDLKRLLARCSVALYANAASIAVLNDVTLECLDLLVIVSTTLHM